MKEIVVQLKRVSKTYLMRAGTPSLFGSLRQWLNRRPEQRVQALREIDLEVRQGQTLGIIGENGSGKTTLLRIINRITFSDNGRIDVRGRVAGLLDLGSGIQADLTGRENIILNGALLGIGRAEMKRLLPDIIAFSGLDRFIDSPAKTFSQGMLVRLGFSVAVFSDPDILLIDDTLAVGDEEFQRRCIQKISELKGKGKTIIVVSHDLSSLKQITDEGVLLHEGRLIKQGPLEEVVSRYLQSVGERQAVACVDQDRLSVIFNRGRLNLLWRGKSLNCGSAGYAAILFNHQWMMSWQLTWNVTCRSARGFRARGIDVNSGTMIELALRVVGERRFFWQMTVTVPQETRPEKVLFGWMFSENYKRYLDGERFKAISASSFGESADLLRLDSTSPLFALAGSAKLPQLLVQFKSRPLGYGLLRAYGQNAVIQHQIVAADKVKVMGEGRLVEDQDLEQLAADRTADKTAYSGRLSLYLQDHLFDFLRGNKRLSAPQGLGFGFLHEGNLVNLFKGRSRVRKTGNGWIIDSEFTSPGLRLNLELDLGPDGLAWRISSSDKEVQVVARFCFDAGYRTWFDLKREENFLPEVDFEESVANLVPELAGLKDETRGSPAVVVMSLNTIEIRSASREEPARIIDCQGAGEVSGKIKIFESQSRLSEFLLEKRRLIGTGISLGNDIHLELSRQGIAIFRKGLCLTVGEGLFTSIFFRGRWHDSRPLIREYLQKNGELTVRLERKVPPMDESWLIRPEGEGFSWQIRLESNEPVSGCVLRGGIELAEDFNQWYSAYEQGWFIPGRMIALRDKICRRVGALAAETALIYETSSAAEPVIQGRTLQFRTGETDLKDSRTVFSGRVGVISRKASETLRRKYCEERFAISNGTYLLRAEHGRMLLFKGKQLLTSGPGFKLDLFDCQGEFDCLNADWDPYRSFGKLVVGLRHREFDFLQRWEFNFSESGLLWKAWVKTEKPLGLSRAVAGLHLVDGFKNWFTGRGQGRIPERSAGSRTTTYITVPDNRSRYIGVNQDSSTQASITFEPLVSMSDWLLNLYLPGKISGCCVGASLAGQDSGYLLPAGETKLFSARIGFSEKMPVLSTESESNAGRRGGGLSLESGEANIRLFWEDNEFTAPLGLFSAFKSKGVRYDSSLAQWKISQLPEELRVELRWNGMEQTWFIRTKEKQLKWEIQTIAVSREIESFSAGLVARDEYTGWSSSEGRGRFEQHPQQVWKNCHQTLFPVTLSSEIGLPELSLDNISNGYNRVENSDVNHSGRIICSEFGSGIRNFELILKLK